MLSFPPGGALERAALVLLEPPPPGANTPGKEYDRLEFHFNPEQLQVSKQSSWPRHLSTDSPDATPPEFSGAQPRSMSLDIFLDSSMGKRTVQDIVELLMGCCSPTPQSVKLQQSSPPWVRLQWGKLKTVAFTAVVSHVSVSYTMFAPDGLPLRAQCSVSLEEKGEVRKEQSPTASGAGGTAAHSMLRGETLASVAYNLYGDPTRWRDIAHFNRVDDPNLVEAGRQLVLPSPLRALGGGRRA
ncbi:peptidase M23 [Streptomyces luteireticuli]|uniref:CIS tube protein n=1 Tax=Streptomyces luteireticuli TaxID=173858 RepID=UPI0035590848